MRKKGTETLKFPERKSHLYRQHNLETVIICLVSILNEVLKLILQTVKKPKKKQKNKKNPATF